MTAPSSSKPTRFFLPWELRTRSTHVVASDLAELADVCRANVAELRQRAELAELTPTAIAILAVLWPIRGLKSGKHGCGAQLSLEEWCEVLGRSRRMVRYGFAQLEELELVARFPELRSVAAVTAHRQPELRASTWIDATGKERENVECVAVTYLTQRGAELVEVSGRTRALRPLKGFRQERLLVACGLLERLLTTLRAGLARAARRLRRTEIDCTPSASAESRKDSGSNSYEVSGVCAEGVEVAPVGAPGSQRRSSTLNPESRSRLCLGSTPSAAQGARAPERVALPSGLIGEGVESPPVPKTRCAGKPSALEAEIDRLWNHHETVATYRQPSRWYAGGDALEESGTRRVWSPIVSVDRWRPEHWRNASPTERRYLAQKFEPLRVALLERVKAHGAELARAELEREEARRRARDEELERRAQILELVAQAEAGKAERHGRPLW